ncbi:MAG: hypothetical protein ACMG6E_00245 [Candidatus Roizmanbacteria bacterium]
MIRMQVYLTSVDYEKLRTKSFEQKRTMSEIIRFALRDNSEEESKRNKPRSTKSHSGLLALAQKARNQKWSGPSDLSTNMDEYLYGQK